MNNELEKVCNALEALSITVEGSWAIETTLTENFGWFAPAITKQDLANVANTLVSDIRSTDGFVISPTMATIVADIPRRIELLTQHTVPHMFNANAGQAIPAYLSTPAFIRTTILPIVGWQAITDSKSLPSNLARRVKAAQIELDNIAPNLDSLAKKIFEIESAHKVADSLPIDLQELAEARDKFNKAAVAVELNKSKSDDAFGDAVRYVGYIKKYNEEAKKLIELCEAAYQITTTKGLAAAFDQRAGKLALSMWTWVIGLVIALGIGSLIGTHRLEVLSNALLAPNPNWGGIVIQSILSLLSVGAPLWFAWLATKQISQRFRLAEDYAFKASVAKAYEGYRKEAARIDPSFEHRLFNSALSRLDEAPLRLVEASTHGSPWQELANSDAARRAFGAFPELQEKVSQLLREAIASTNKVISKPHPIAKQIEEPKE